jgi:hypothetical protein
MCTVSYLPIPGGFVLTTNRDEDPGRKTGQPEKITLANGCMITTPLDLEKGGSWIAADESGRATCLLNGAFARHKRQPPYLRSRGKLVLEAFEAPDFDFFSENISLSGMEPFTQVFISPQRLLKMVWDGSRKYLWELAESTPHLWSSPTLYSPAQHGAKEVYFKEALRQGKWDPEYILMIHGNDGESPFILSRPTVRTVSITQVIMQGVPVVMKYFPKEAKYENPVSVRTSV